MGGAGACQVPYQVAYDRVLPHAYQVANPFHVVRLANRCVDLVRRRVQNETLGHRGRNSESVRDIYQIGDPQLAAEFTQRLSGVL